MLDLSPTKLVIIFVVAIVLLGPKRLPQLARQLGAAWAKVRTFSHRIDSELRQTMPDLPTSRDIVRYARSPMTLLNELADGSPVEAGAPGVDSETPESSAALGATSGNSGGVQAPGYRGAAERPDLHVPREPGDLALLAVDDPTLN